jgi:hypothetical protein
MSGCHRTKHRWLAHPAEWLACSRESDTGGMEGEVLREVQVGIDTDGTPLTLEVAVPAPHNLPRPERLSDEARRYLCRMQERLQALNTAIMEDRRRAFRIT